MRISLNFELNLFTPKIQNSQKAIGLRMMGAKNRKKLSVMEKLTLQLSQHNPAAHWASVFSLQVMLSQHGSCSHSSLVPQSHSSSSSTILLPQFRRSISNYENNNKKKTFQCKQPYFEQTNKQKPFKPFFKQRIIQLKLWYANHCLLFVEIGLNRLYG